MNDGWSPDEVNTLLRGAEKSLKLAKQWLLNRVSKGWDQGFRSAEGDIDSNSGSPCRARLSAGPAKDVAQDQGAL